MTVWKPQKTGTALSVALIVSTVTHLAVFLLVFWWSSLFPLRLKEQQTYFVELSDLPVAAPRSGHPVQQQEQVAHEPPAPPKAPPAMPLPPLAKPATKRAAIATKPLTIPKAAPKASPRSTAAAPDSSAEFEERLNKIRSRNEAEQQEAKLEELRRKVTTANARSGMPSATGSEAGSDYLNYIASRLAEVFSEPPNTGKDLFALIKIRITGKGRVELVKIMKSSGNIAFDNYAVRSVYEAEKKFPPPPGGNFEFIFKFRPQGITSR
ncbi:cell envelope integrity protein TolA [Geobacter sp. SVR]|uniref:cell envelope integrity protein TolA n=1 Tax=Geobacter sp. SVR TaxID=2495594 RepID=UPI00143EF8D3|nr:cell envelope integrity protein TolA [Geobacter sp. SVR]BCS56077.1 energy transduction protein TonB [Geobacter sp. SVR]GCF84840.1 energy transduction protein TonB [Geobacter sp. SVR]